MATDQWTDPVMLGAVLDAFPCPALIVGVDRRIRAANAAFESRLGSGAAAAGQRCFEVLHGRRRPCPPRKEACPLVTCARTGRPTPALHTHCLGAGSVDEQVLLRPLAAEDGTVVACLATLEAEERRRGRGEEELGAQVALAVAPVRDRLPRLARDRRPVLLLGEPGSGKWCVARAIHWLGPAGGDYEARSGFGLTADALRAIWARGAHRRRGTLYLGNVHALERRTQSALVERLGGTPGAWRVVAGTDRDLHRLVRVDRFREDLWRRLSAHVLRLPPLRSRAGEIPQIAAMLLQEISGARSKLTDAAAERLRRYLFPGNLDELARALRHASLTARGGIVDAAHLPDWVDGPKEPPPSAAD